MYRLYLRSKVVYNIRCNVTGEPAAAPTTPMTAWTSASRPQPTGNPYTYYTKVNTRDGRVPVRHFGYPYPTRPILRRNPYPYRYQNGRVYSWLV